MTVLRAAALRGLPHLVKELGGDPAAYLSAANFSADVLDDDSAYIPHRKAIRLLERVATELRCPDLGLRLANAQDISVLGPLAVAMQHAQSIGAALERVKAHLYIHSPSLRMSLARQTTRRVVLSIAVNLQRLGACPQTMDLSIGLTHKNLRLLGGEAYSTRIVHLSHPPLASPDAYEAFFEGPVVFNSDFDGLIFDEDLLNVPLLQANIFLEQVIADYFDVKSTTAKEHLVPQVRVLASRLLRTGRCTLAEAASSLGMHPRTLQRYLSSCGSSFEHIVEEVRREAALRHLQDLRMPLTTLALILGYSELSAFSRSCRRWFGACPRSVRRRLGAHMQPVTATGDGGSALWTGPAERGRRIVHSRSD